MPTLTRWFLRAAIVHLVLGLCLGVALASDALPAGGWQPVYVHLLVMGWATQMIFGVAYWMFPRRRPLDLSVFDRVGWTCFLTMNGGLALRALAEPVAGSAGCASGVLLAAALLQLIAIVAFVAQAWPRVMAR